MTTLMSYVKGNGHKEEKVAVKRPPGISTFEVISGSNMPNMDGPGDLSDCYCKVSIVTGTGEYVALPVVTSVCRDNLDPVWCTFVSFPVVPDPTDRIKIEVLDEDTFTSDDYIGFVREAIGAPSVVTSMPLTLPLTLLTKVQPKRETEPCTLTFRWVSTAPAGEETALRKTIFVIRHGESIWNDAHCHMNVRCMLQQYDHELNATGIAQVRSSGVPVISD